MNAEMHEKTYILQNLGCANCAAKMERKIQALPDVKSASITFATKQLRVEAPDPTALEEEMTHICQSIEGDVFLVEKGRHASSAAHNHAGYNAQLTGSHDVSNTTGSNNFESSVKLPDGLSKTGNSFLSEHKKTLITLIVGAVLFAGGVVMSHLFPDDAWFTGGGMLHLINAVIFIGAYILLGYQVLFTAARNIGHGQVFDENFLMSIATIAAFCIGDFAEGVGVMLFYRIGELFEDIAVEKSRSQIMEAVDMRPETVMLVNSASEQNDDEHCDCGHEHAHDHNSHCDCGCEDEHHEHENIHFAHEHHHDEHCDCGCDHEHEHHEHESIHHVHEHQHQHHHDEHCDCGCEHEHNLPYAVREHHQHEHFKHTDCSHEHDEHCDCGCEHEHEHHGHEHSHHEHGHRHDEHCNCGCEDEHEHHEHEHSHHEHEHHHDEHCDCGCEDDHEHHEHAHIHHEHNHVQPYIRIIPASEANTGDVLLVRPGDRIPLDGIVIEGESRIDTSPVTGEPVPVSARPGTEVISGCVNEQGVLKIQVTKPLEESMVTRILDSVENAAAGKPKIDKFITKFARIYTPIVVALAVLTAVIPSLVTGNWALWIKTAITFLVISCPCALVISVPLAFFSGIGAASKLGILFKGGLAIEALKNVKAIIMDKTGTITRGVFEVDSVSAFGDFAEEDIISIAAACESASSHPIAVSIITKAQQLTDTEDIHNADTNHSHAELQKHELNDSHKIHECNEHDDDCQKHSHHENFISEIPNTDSAINTHIQNLAFSASLHTHTGTEHETATFKKEKCRFSVFPASLQEISGMGIKAELTITGGLCNSNKATRIEASDTTGTGLNNAMSIRTSNASNVELSSTPCIGLDSSTGRTCIALCGNRKLMTKFDIALPELPESSGTEILVALDGTFIGRIIISDKLKEDSVSAISNLKSMGLTPAMLTGDNMQSAAAVASESGISTVRAGLLPEDKVSALKELRDELGAVMFVGDGINDAPVLAGADVGAAMGAGADAAIEAADVVFMNSSLAAIPQAVSIARYTGRIAMQNIIFALAIKLFVIILGLIGFANIWAAVFADTGVAMLCILNSLRVMWKKYDR